MRNGQNKRMRGRNRRGHNPLTRVYESNGPDVKIRGTAHHIAEKYLQLARDAQSSGDPISAEGYLQYAEHYFRLIAAAQAQFIQQNPHQQHQIQPLQRSDMDGRDEYDDEGDDGGTADSPGEQPYAAGTPQPSMSRNQPQPNYQNAPQPRENGEPPRDVGLPAFITGTQGTPQPNVANGQQGEPGGDRDGGRFNRRGRRFRPRGPRDFDQREAQPGASGSQPEGQGQAEPKPAGE